jgi:hypothetical protein
VHTMGSGSPVALAMAVAWPYPTGISGIDSSESSLVVQNRPEGLRAPSRTGGGGR